MSQNEIITNIHSILGKRFTVPITSTDDCWVEFVDIMPHPSGNVTPETAIVNAARTSYLGDSKGYENDMKLLKYLWRNGHLSPFEMVEYKFRIHAPVLVWWQWVRHRVWNYNLQSGRYVSFEQDDFYIPNVWRKQSASNKQGSDGFFSNDEQDEIINNMYDGDNQLLTDFISYADDMHNSNYSGFNRLLKTYYDLGYLLYKSLLDSGGAKEESRLFVAGFGAMYTGVVKVDARNLTHFLNLRLHEHAQEEIRMYAKVISDEILKPSMPVLYELMSE